jgi:hypothetical protein
MIERPRAQWVPRKDRAPKSITGVAYRDDGSWVRVHMTNLSYDGCHLLIDREFSVSETLTLVMPRMQHLKVQVRWVTDGQAGVRILNGSAADDRRARLGL